MDNTSSFYQLELLILDEETGPKEKLQSMIKLMADESNAILLVNHAAKFAETLSDTAPLKLSITEDSFDPDKQLHGFLFLGKAFTCCRWLNRWPGN